MTLNLMEMPSMEDKIMSCWTVVDQLKSVVELTESSNRDEICNVLQGIITIYDHRFDSLFKEYESLLKENHKLKVRKHG